MLTQHVGDRHTGLSALALTVPIAALTAAVPGIPQAAGHLSVEVVFTAAGLALLFPVSQYALDLLALRHMTQSAFGTLMALEPAVGVLLGLLVLSQEPSPVQLLGIVVVVVAGAAAQRGGLRTPPPGPHAADGDELAVPLSLPQPTRSTSTARRPRRSAHPQPRRLPVQRHRGPAVRPAQAGRQLHPPAVRRVQELARRARLRPRADPRPAHLPVGRVLDRDHQQQRQPARRRRTAPGRRPRDPTRSRPSPQDPELLGQATADLDISSAYAVASLNPVLPQTSPGAELRSSVELLASPPA